MLRGIEAEETGESALLSTVEGLAPMAYCVTGARSLRSACNLGVTLQMIGGILGGTYWGWMYVDVLWVHENHRHKGIGSKLLREAETEALCRGCHHVHLDTMSWQAPEFYKKHGYEVIGILPNIPNGNQKYLLMKAL